MLGKFINHKEDSLTAAVFTHLLHLPSEVFWRILRNACYTKSLPEGAGEPRSVEFWPNWDPAGTNNTTRVVPDLFIRFASFDLIIEAKRWDSGQQSPEQWKKEVTAYANQYGGEVIPIRMIALGGTWDTKDEMVKVKGISCPVHMCKWERILAECQRKKKELAGLKCPTSQTKAWLRTLVDLIDLFGWHGYSTGLWFTDFNFTQHRLSGSIAPHHALLQKRTRQLIGL